MSIRAHEAEIPIESPKMLRITCPNEPSIEMYDIPENERIDNACLYALRYIVIILMFL